MSDARVYEQAFNLLCDGDQVLGRGMSRVVYGSVLLPDVVIKVEDRAGYFQNVVEWETWQRVKNTPASRWFAECRHISSDGTVLIMERTRPPAPQEFPDQMPIFLCDFKRTNYGMAPSRKVGKDWLVCHDYGTHLMFEHGASKRLRKANWYNAGE